MLIELNLLENSKGHTVEKRYDDGDIYIGLGKSLDAKAKEGANVAIVELTDLNIRIKGDGQWYDAMAKLIKKKDKSNLKDLIIAKLFEFNGHERLHKLSLILLATGNWHGRGEFKHEFRKLMDLTWKR